MGAIVNNNLNENQSQKHKMLRKCYKLSVLKTRFDK